MTRKRFMGLVLVAVLLSGVGVAYASEQGLYGGHAQSQRNRSAAFADAMSRLGRLQVPADAGAKSTVPGSELHAIEGAMDHADVAAQWTVPGTLSSVIGYVRRHRPAGSAFFSSGYNGNPGSITSRSVTFDWPAVNDVLASRLLLVSVSSAHDGEVELYAQAESIWFSARPEGERFPASVRRIVLRVSRPKRSTVVRVVTRQQTVGRAVELLDAVPITQPDVYNCPAFTTVQSFSYSLQSQSGATLASIRYEVPPRAAPSPCEPMNVTISGRRQHALLGGPQIVELQRIFGIPTDNSYL